MDFLGKNSTNSVINLPIEGNCINKSFFELHMQSEINFTQYDYIRQKNTNMSMFELILKLVLCLASIIASLFGNIMVIYSILIKPSLKRKNSHNHFDCYLPQESNNESYNSNRSRLNNIRYSREFANNLLQMPRQSNTPSIKKNGEFLILSNGHDVQDENDLCIEKRIFVTRIYKPHRNKPVNLFILNLCFCDLMIVLWCSWVHMVNSLSENWKMGAFFCKLNTYVQG